MRRHLPFWIVVGAAFLCAVFLGGAALILKRAWSNSRAQVDVTLERTARVVENAVNRQLVQVDIALASLPTLLASLDASNDGVGSEEANRLLRGLNFQAYAFRDILLVRPDGTVWASARPRPRNRPLPSGSLGTAITTPGQGVIVNGPLRNPLTGEWALFLSRPASIQGPGQLLAVAEVPLSTISNLMAEAAYGPNMRVLLERGDGTLLASFPHDELKIGQLQAAAIGRIRADGIAFDVSSQVLPTPTLAAARPTLYSDITVAATLDAETALRSVFRWS
jgi:hypothetical protein